MSLDLDAVIAAADLAKRAGATDFTIGHVRDESDVAAFAELGAGWWASATWKGRKLFVEDYLRPDAAADAFAVELLVGATCAHCGRPVSITTPTSTACTWRRTDKRWARGCEA